MAKVFGQIKKIISEIVDEADSIIKEKIDENFLIDFVDIFPKSEKEKGQLTKEIEKIGKEILQTETGKIYRLSEPIITKFGPLSLIKIRIFDAGRTQRGAPDFKVKDYANFKHKYLADNSFKLIVRNDYEMLELRKEGRNVLIYFPDKTLSESL